MKPQYFASRNLTGFWRRDKLQRICRQIHVFPSIAEMDDGLRDPDVFQYFKLQVDMNRITNCEFCLCFPGSIAYGNTRAMNSSVS